MSNMYLIRCEEFGKTRSIKFYWDEDLLSVCIKDTKYDNFSYKKLIRRKNKSLASTYRIHSDSGKRKSWIISERDVLITKINNNLPLDNVDWTLNIFGLDIVTIKNYIINVYVNKGINIPTYTHLNNFPNKTIENSIFNYFIKKGGVNEYNKLLNTLGQNVDFLYKTHEGKLLRSYVEFMFFSILHYNNIDFEYEPEKIDKYIPDFKIKGTNHYVELCGYNTKSSSSHSIKYNNRIDRKKNKYDELKINVSFIQTDRNTFDEIFNSSVEIFGELKKPNIFEYFEKYALCGESFINHLKNLALLYARGEIDSNYLLKHHQSEYLKILSQYGSMYNFCDSFMSMDDLVLTTKGYKYFYNLSNCFKWLDYYKNKFSDLPKYTRFLSKNNFVNLYSIYRIYGVNEFKKGGIFENYASFYMNSNKLIFNVLDSNTNMIYSSIQDAYENSTKEFEIGEMYSSFRRKGKIFYQYHLISPQQGLRIKNLNTGEIYYSMKHCCENNNCNLSGLEQHFKRLRRGQFKGNSKYSHLIPLD
jgi:hypothetical protein